MKKINLLVLCAGLCLSCSPLVAMQPETVTPTTQDASDEGLFTAAVYKSRARNLLTEVLKGVAFSIEDASEFHKKFTLYLNKRIENASLISTFFLSSSRHVLSEAEKSAYNDERRILLTKPKPGPAPFERLCHYFPKMTRENLVSGIRTNLGWPQPSDFFEVTQEEFDKADKQFSPLELQRLLFIESKMFAQAILKILPERQRHFGRSGGHGNYLVSGPNHIQVFDGTHSFDLEKS
ncbi:MAG: hypothetical protein WCW33_01050 [Candidatus Babeliales bacterium]